MFGVAGLRWSCLTGSAFWRKSLAAASWMACWLLGHVAGGLACGAALGMAGGLLSLDTRVEIAGAWSAICLALTLRHWKLLNFEPPQWKRQVSQEWMFRLPWDLVALGYGFQLGTGVATRITGAVLYAAMGCAFLSGSPGRGAMMIACFGAARAIPPLWFGPRLASPSSSLAFAASLSRRETAVLRLDAFTLLAATAVFAAAFLMR
jgi:hypothetical protein